MSSEARGISNAAAKLFASCSMRLTLLAPDIIERLLAGRQPRRLTLIWFQRNPIPVDWQAQRQVIASFE